MRAPDRPSNEQARLHSLYELELLDRDNTAMFDGAVEMASQITGCPIALVSLVDSDRQWFAAARNLNATETGRDVSFCGHTILGNDVFVVPDARLDARFHDNPLVTSDPSIVFYAGAPLVMPDGTTLGTVCVIDREPRYLSERQTLALAQLGRFVVDQLELRRSLLRLERQTSQQIAEHQRQSARLSALGRNLEQAMQGVAALVADKLGADAMNAEASIRDLMDTVKRIQTLGISIGESGMTALSDSELSLSRVDPAQVLNTVLETFAAECNRRGIGLDVRTPAEPIELRTDRERLRFLCFHLLGFLLSPTQDGGSLTLKVRPDPQSGAEISGYLLRDQPHETTELGRQDLNTLENIARGLNADVTTLLDEQQQLMVRVRLPLEL